MSKKAIQIIIGVFLFCFVYSVLRYHVAGDVGYKDFPLYVLNKAVALAGFTLLTINFVLGPAKGLGADVPDAWLAARKEIGIVAFMMIFSHLVAALLLVGSGGYYAKFFDPESGFNAVGSWSMLFGILAFAWLWLYNISFKTRQEGDEAFIKMVTSTGSILLAAFLSAGHIAVMGYKAWFQPGTWAGGMPPITLVAIVIFVIGLVIFLKGRR